MSYLRGPGKYTDCEYLYVFPSGEHINWMAADPTNPKHVFELMMSVLKRADIELEDDEIEKIKDELFIGD